jgi:hypothetical protein
MGFNIGQGLTSLAQIGADIYSAQYQAKKTSDFAGQQREYETNMSNTAYQRAVADMKAAGLNPMLAFSQGGATTPNVGSGSVAKPDINIAGSMERSSASSLNREMSNTQKTIQHVNSAQASKVLADTQAVLQNINLKKPEETIKGAVQGALDKVGGYVNAAKSSSANAVNRVNQFIYDRIYPTRR